MMRLRQEQEEEDVAALVLLLEHRRRRQRRQKQYWIRPWISQRLQSGAYDHLMVELERGRCLLSTLQENPETVPFKNHKNYNPANEKT